MMRELNNDIPDNIKLKILNNPHNIEYEHFVYRVAKTGIIELDTFDSTYEEIQKKIIPANKPLDKPSTYSTSGYIDKKQTIKFLKTQKRKYHPPACLICGKTKYGLVSEIPDPESTHIDWWIYDGYKAKLVEENCFQICEEEGDVT